MGKSIEIKSRGEIFPNYQNPLKKFTLRWLLDMSETSVNTKCETEGFSSFQSVLTHDLGYWDFFSPQVALTLTRLGYFESSFF